MGAKTLKSLFHKIKDPPWFAGLREAWRILSAQIYYNIFSHASFMQKKSPNLISAWPCASKPHLSRNRKATPLPSPQGRE